MLSAAAVVPDALFMEALPNSIKICGILPSRHANVISCCHESLSTMYIFYAIACVEACLAVDALVIDALAFDV
jgi:hypothetical protein